MAKERSTTELQALQEWFGTYPDPELADESVAHLKAVIAAEVWRCSGTPDDVPQPTTAAVQRIRRQTRQALALAGGTAGRRPAPQWGWRLQRSWLVAAAAVALVVGINGVLHSGAREPAPQVQLTWWPAEISAIEQDLLELEWQSFVRESPTLDSGEVSDDDIPGLGAERVDVNFDG